MHGIQDAISGDYKGTRANNTIFPTLQAFQENK